MDDMKENNELNGLGARLNEEEKRGVCRDVKVGYIETAVADFKRDIGDLFKLITDLRLENKGIITRQSIFLMLFQICLTATLAVWLKK